MTTKEFKAKFTKFPESGYLSYYLQQFILLGRSNNLADYFWNTKDINDVNDTEELYRIKGQIFLLKSSCERIVEMIGKMNFHLAEEFDDTSIELKEIGVYESDMFECIRDYMHWNMLLISKGDKIKIEQFMYAGANSLFEITIQSNSDEESGTQNAAMPLFLTFKEFRENFKSIR